MAWNRPELRTRVQQVNEEWRRVLTEAFAPALREYGFGALSLEASVSLVIMMAQGYALERLSDIHEGHATMLAEMEAWMGRGSKRPEPRGPKPRARRRGARHHDRLAADR